MKLKLLIITLIAGIVYGIIEALVLLISEKTIEERIYDLEINHRHFFDRFAAGLLTGGIASTIALLISAFIAKKLKEKMHIEENVFLDALGILLGCILITISYILYKFLRKKRQQNKTKTLTTKSH